MRTRVAVVYNEPFPSRYDTAGEKKAVLGVLQAVTAVHESLLELGYEVALVPLSPPLEEALKKLDSLDARLVFNLFEGFCGEPQTEALIPEALDGLGVPYTGCSGKVLRLALDKATVKVMLKAAGIPTPDFQLLNDQLLPTFHLGYPCIVKPRSEDASHGITGDSMVTNFPSLEKRVLLVSKTYGNDALVEEFIDGREFNASALGNSEVTVLPISEIAYSLPPEMPRILTFEAKWETGSPYFKGTQVICPADIKPEERKAIARTVKATYQLLGCQGYARVDMRYDREGRLNVLEVNPNPDISPGTGAARQAKASGMSYTQFVEKIVQLALERKNHDNQSPPHAEERQTSPDGHTAEYTGIQAFGGNSSGGAH